MRILGIDPGYAIMGFAVVEIVEKSIKFVDCGVVVTSPKLTFPERLEKIFEETMKLFKKYKPDIAAIEDLYFRNNQKTAICVAQSRGVMVLASKISGVVVVSYTPAQIKMAVTGCGKAKKFEIISSMRTLLKLNFDPTPDDAADAIAIAVCHAGKVNELHQGDE
ncbi:MAG: crossover junction endodeoxyribonuclease RuvC [Candidatus Improbicoccus pseudotrichonymphae]|uniref:Crossover junction endodeoxyribonuclease RuvC n=1 Tax=Candidatus Improbicoccus pseudotrichonymphae TaxID=3033792 RepID=A0AA48HV69_9FIRM|nr:MAG: crossover junction endodeoxyribonuclease RuvC [Candidatus Improbicoccus pseudotrichonymphae]